MKIKITLLFLFLTSGFLFSQIINIPDSVFKSKLIEEGVDTNNDGEIQESEALVITDLDVLAYASEPKIESLEGIQYFTNLISFDFSRNLITSFNASIFENLEYLRGYSNELTNINLTGLNNLTYLNIRYNNIASLDLNSLINLELLFLGHNESISFDLSSLINLTFFECNSCELSSIDFQQNNNLDEISIDNNLLSNINFSDLPQLRILFMDNNLFTELDLTEAGSLVWIECRSNTIETINIDGLTNLNIIDISDNLISEIDGSNTSLTYLHCDDNPNLTTINVQNGYFAYPDPDMLDMPFQFNNLPNLTSICMDLEDGEALNYSGYIPENVTVFTGPNCTLGINEFSLEETYIYPNPVKDSFTINSNSEITNYILYDLAGKEVITSNKFNLINSKVISITSGIYFLQLESLSGNKAVIKFVKE